MPNIVKCPECEKPLKLSEAFAGKRVRCPTCQHRFVAPEAEAEEEELPVVSDEEDGVQEEGPAKRSRRVADDDNDDDDEEDRPRRSSRSRRRSVGAIERGASIPFLPLLLGVLSCLTSCAPIIGFPLGYWATMRAGTDMNELPGGRGAEGARQMVHIGNILGLIGMGLSAVFLVLGIIGFIANIARR